MASITNSLYDLGDVLMVVEAPEFLGPNRIWNAINDQQRSLLENLPHILPHLAVLREAGLLDAKVSWNVSDINTWFAAQGLSIQLTDAHDPDVFYAGSIYEQLVKWKQKGKVRALRAMNGEVYEDGVEIKSGFSAFKSTVVPDFGVRIETEDEQDSVYMVPLDNPPTEPFALLLLAQRVFEDMNLLPYFDSYVRFPMVDLSMETDVSWLKGFWTRRDSGQRATIIEAKQQQILKINEEGVLSKSGTGTATALESTPSGVTINRPFLFFVARSGLPLPLFAAWVDYNDWRSPGKLK